MMNTDNENLEKWIAVLDKKPDVNDFINKSLSNPETIPVLLEIMKMEKGTVRYYSEKIVRRISELNPLLLYPYFKDIADLINSSNNFIRWGAILTISNLVSIDDENKFDCLYEEYFSLINSASMITAGNVIEGAWKIVLKHPRYEEDITGRFLKVTENTYINKGEPSPECGNIIIGKVIDSFDKYYHLSNSKGRMIDFAASQINNSRKSVARKAAGFLEKHTKEG
ncbi:MAG: hypothetical protein WCG21_13750 [Eubacteriales bacterium]